MKPDTTEAQRLPAETLYADELERIQNVDSFPKPKGWQLSPQAVRAFILGGSSSPFDQISISRKIYGNDIVVERSIVTLMGRQGLILVGEPGTAKSLLSELLSAAISGVSTYTVQGGAGVMEEQIRYSWNYALLLNKGPGTEALVPGPLYSSMLNGKLMRFEEITRCPTEVQDCLISVLSDRILHIPELDEEKSMLFSKQGFNIIATANLRDRGVNDMSGALKRRFNFETMMPLDDPEIETELVMREVNRQLADEGIEQQVPADVIAILVTVFQELRDARALDTRLDPMSSTMSTAEAIHVAFSAAVEDWYLSSREMQPSHLLKHLNGTVIKDDDDDRKRMRHYLGFIKNKRKKQKGWQDFFKGEKWV